VSTLHLAASGICGVADRVGSVRPRRLVAAHRTCGGSGGHARG
jgi:hypothetical protein